MTAITDGGFPNIANLLNSMHPDGSALKLTNVLTKINEVMNHISWQPSNQITSHLIEQTVNSLPSGTFRKLNSGVARTKGQTKQYVETCARIEDFTDIDEAMVELAGGPEYRLKQDMIKKEGLAQQFVTSLFYADTGTDPEKFLGMAPRYPATTGYTASSYTLDGTAVGGSAGAGSNAHSVWLINWDPDKIYGIYPKGTQMGLDTRDKGQVNVADASSNDYYVWRTQHIWRCGLCVEDYRYAVRMQWDPDDALMADTDKGLLQLMQAGMDTIQVRQGARFYMDRTSMKKYHAQILNNEGRLQATMQDGAKVVEQFFGLPIHLVEGLVAETAIS